MDSSKNLHTLLALSLSRSGEYLTEMNRVLSIEQSRSCSGQSVYVTKRLCISVAFSVGFLCVLGGYLLGRMSADSQNGANCSNGKSDGNQASTVLIVKLERMARIGRRFSMNRRKNTDNGKNNIEHMLSTLYQIFKCDKPTKDNPKWSLNDHLNDMMVQKTGNLSTMLDEATLYLESIKDLYW